MQVFSGVVRQKAGRGAYQRLAGKRGGHGQEPGCWGAKTRLARRMSALGSKTRRGRGRGGGLKAHRRRTGATNALRQAVRAQKVIGGNRGGGWEGQDTRRVRWPFLQYLRVGERAKMGSQKIFDGEKTDRPVNYGDLMVSGEVMPYGYGKGGGKRKRERCAAT